MKNENFILRYWGKIDFWLVNLVTEVIFKLLFIQCALSDIFAKIGG